MKYYFYLISFDLIKRIDFSNNSYHCYFPGLQRWS